MKWKLSLGLKIIVSVQLMRPWTMERDRYDRVTVFIFCLWPKNVHRSQLLSIDCEYNQVIIIRTWFISKNWTCHRRRQMSNSKQSCLFWRCCLSKSSAWFKGEAIAIDAMTTFEQTRKRDFASFRMASASLCSSALCLISLLFRLFPSSSQYKVCSLSRSWCSIACMLMCVCLRKPKKKKKTFEIDVCDAEAQFSFVLHTFYALINNLDE